MKHVDDHSDMTTSDEEVEGFGPFCGPEEPKVEVDKAHKGGMPCDKQLRVALVALFATMGSTLFGLDIGYIGPIIESKSFKYDVEHLEHGNVSSQTEGLIVSLFSIGAIFTAFPVISSYFIDEWGRKKSIMAGSAVFVVGSIIQLTCNGNRQLFVGRFVSGMAIGLLSAVIVLYQSEMAPASMRGALSTLYQLGITFGILLAAFIDQMLVDREEGWRVVMGVICLPAAILVVGMFFLPCSPRWLVQKGRRKEALKVLLTMRTPEEAAKEEEEIYQEIQASREEGEVAWSELFQGRCGRLVLLGIVLQILQQLVGMNAFMYFGPKIFESIGFDKNMFTTINNFVNFLASFPAVFLADRAGRRQLMIWSALGMTLACGLMGLMGTLYVVPRPADPLNPDVEAGMTVSNKSAGWVIAGSAFFFVFNFAFGFGPIVWVYCAEIFPMRCRARALGVTTVANWVGNFIIAQFTPVMLDTIQFSTFFVFGFFCFLGVLISAYIPETKGVPLENIQELFDRKVGFRSTAVGHIKAPPAPPINMDSSDSEE